MVSFNLNFIIFLSTFLKLISCDNSDIVGTWTSKSNAVFTGPGFYDPVDELLIEPALTGISYSFTEDGHWEEALYRVTSNPKNHSCATAVLIFQHGTYEILSNGTVQLTPIAVDGRQLLSDPCNDDGQSVYSRYVQEEVFDSFYVQIDDYYGRYKLQIYQFDGSLKPPLYLAYRPPLMLPTDALNPTNAASETATSLRRKVKRSLENQYKTNAVKAPSINYDFWWWVSLGVMGVGSLGFFLN